ncbi:hypothetical protein TcWFU_008972 [Taenia crassiceps]|uniref:Uncharacterized protein n=1 Tax=Taenia crassiceps TaxID=6207 RepID=A0ABR4Q2Y4_9CEST
MTDARFTNTSRSSTFELKSAQGGTLIDIYRVSIGESFTHVVTLCGQLSTEACTESSSHVSSHSLDVSEEYCRVDFGPAAAGALNQRD